MEFKCARKADALIEMVRDYAIDRGLDLNYCDRATEDATDFRFYRAPVGKIIRVRWDEMTNVFETFGDILKEIDRTFGFDRPEKVKSSPEYRTYCRVDISTTEKLLSACGYKQGECVTPMGAVTGIKRVIFNPPATIVMWTDGTKTVVKAQETDMFDPWTGLAMAISKKALGNQGNYFEVFKKWVEPWEEENDEGLAPKLKRSIKSATKAAKRVGKSWNALMRELEAKYPPREKVEIDEWDKTTPALTQEEVHATSAKVGEPEPKPWRIWFKRYDIDSGEFLSAGKHPYEYKTKYSAKRAATRMYGVPFRFVRYEWIVAQENPWKEEEE